MIRQNLLFFAVLLTSAPTGPPPHPTGNGTAHFYIPQKTPPRASTQSATPRRSTSRITNRTIQTLRQTNLLVRARQRSWTEILLVRQPSRLIQTGNGLRSNRIQGARRVVSFELQIDSRHLGRDLQHQPGVVVSTGRILVERCLHLFAHQRFPCLAFL